jgi:hypothetical protein
MLLSKLVGTVWALSLAQLAIAERPLYPRANETETETVEPEPVLQVEPAANKNSPGCTKTETVYAEKTTVTVAGPKTTIKTTITETKYAGTKTVYEGTTTKYAGTTTKVSTIKEGKYTTTVYKPAST